MDAMITAVIVHYVICRSHIGYANTSLEQSFHLLFIFICIFTNMALDLFSTSCSNMQIITKVYIYLNINLNKFMMETYILHHEFICPEIMLLVSKLLAHYQEVYIDYLQRVYPKYSIQ
jgi:hypothetical protein